MRPFVTFFLLLLLAGCASWSWHDFGQSLLQSVCDSFEPCSVPCDSASGAC